MQPQLGRLPSTGCGCSFIRQSSNNACGSATTPTPLELYPALAFDRLFKDAATPGDKSVLDLLGADYTFVNERLADHYGIDGVFGDAFRRVLEDVVAAAPARSVTVVAHSLGSQLVGEALAGQSAVRESLVDAPLRAAPPHRQRGKPRPTT